VCAARQVQLAQVEACAMSWTGKMNDASDARNSAKGLYEPSGRSAVDLDELERQLRQMASSRPAQVAADPLAQLANFADKLDPYVKQASPAEAKAVDQGDPSKMEDPLLALERALQGGPLLTKSRVEPRFQSEPDVQNSDKMQPARDALEAFLISAPEPHENNSFSASSVDVEHERALPLSVEDVAPAYASLSHQQSSESAPAHQPDAYQDTSYNSANYAGAAYRATTHSTPTSTRAAKAYEQEPEYAPEPEYIEQDYAPLAPRRSRKGLLTVASVLGVGVIGVALALSFKSSEPKAPAGEPPVVKAETGPARVQPANPGGVEIPNQNKQIYERATGAAPSKSNVVNTTEQPIDLNQAVRNVAPRVVLPGGTTPDTATASPTVPVPPTAQPQAAAPNGVAAVLGEPKRVKTVSVRPDGTIVSSTEASVPAATAAAPSASLSGLSAPSLSAPSLSAPSLSAPSVPALAPLPPKPPAAGVTPSAAKPAEPKPAPARQPKPASGGDVSADASAPLSIAPTQNAAQAKSQQRITAPVVSQPVVNSPTIIARAPSTPAATAPAQAASGSGSFSVQLAAPGSDKEARDTFSSLQRKFPNDLGGMSPSIRRAEVGERTIYRLRVGPMERAEATSLCESLKYSGGQCFVARN
jgi:SPOR domain